MVDCAYFKAPDECWWKRIDKPPCEQCCGRLSLDDDGFASKWIDPLRVIDRRRQETDCLRDLLAGSPAVLLCGGPSANDLPLGRLSERGVWTMAVNNAAAHPRVRPQAFICADPPSKFSHSIWFDPGVMKFTATPKLTHKHRGLLRKKDEGKFVELDRRVPDCPNTWAYERNSWLWPDHRFFTSSGACWGNHESGVNMTGQPKTVCTMLLAMRLLYYLGARRIYLVGVDFRMAPNYGYSFDQERTPEACVSNNGQFKIVNRWLCQMQATGVFKHFGVEFFNCFERSGLRAFPYVPFDVAGDDCRGICEKVPDLAGWYEK